MATVLWIWHTSLNLKNVVDVKKDKSEIDKEYYGSIRDEKIL